MNIISFYRITCLRFVRSYIFLMDKAIDKSLDDLTICSICMTSVNKLGSLECGHSFCHDCIEKKWKNDGSKIRKTQK